MFSLKAASLSTLCILALTAGLAGVARAQSEQESYFSPERGWGLASPAFNNPHRVSWKTAVITDQTHLHAVPAGFAQLLLTNHSPANMEFIIDPWVGRDSKGQLFIGTGWFDVHVPPLGFAHVITPSGTCAIEIAVKSEAKREEAGKISEYIFDEGHFFQDVPTGSKTTIEVSWQPLPGTGGTVSGAPPERPTTSSRIAGAPVLAAIGRISAGAHQHFPEPQRVPLAAGQRTGWDLRNDTQYALHVYVAGPTTQEIRIPVGQASHVDLPFGYYKIAADVPASNVLPFYAERTLASDSRWQSDFYIRIQQP